MGYVIIGPQAATVVARQRLKAVETRHLDNGQTYRDRPSGILQLRGESDVRSLVTQFSATLISPFLHWYLTLGELTQFEMELFSVSLPA